MFHFEVRRTLPVSPEAIWAVITNASLLQTGPFGISAIKGKIAPGETISLWSDASPGRAFKLKVTGFSPASSMTWEGGLPFGLFWGVRKFTLTQTPQGCEFHMREDYSGLLSGLIRRSMPDLTPSFNTFAEALAGHFQENNR